MTNQKTSELFTEYFAKIEDLLRNCEEATQLPVRLVKADAGFKLPSAQHETCRRSLEHSDSAVECLRKALDHIEKKLDQSVTLADAAQTVALSPDRFSRVSTASLSNTPASRRDNFA